MDILCQAKSGMGKTAVFVLATLQQIEPIDGQVGVQYNRQCVWKFNELFQCLWQNGQNSDQEFIYIF